MPTDAVIDQLCNLDKSDDNAASITSDADSDFEGDPGVRDARDSAELAENDCEVLKEEKEREKLLTGKSKRAAPPGFFKKKRMDERLDGEVGIVTTKTPRRSQKRRRHTRVGRDNEEGRLMYEMEEGGPRSDTSSLASSSSTALDELNTRQSSISKVRGAAVMASKEAD